MLYNPCYTAHAIQPMLYNPWYQNNMDVVQEQTNPVAGGLVSSRCFVTARHRIELVPTGYRDRECEK